MQVSLLKLNSGISRAVETTTTLERQNAALEAVDRQAHGDRPDPDRGRGARDAHARRRRRRLPAGGPERRRRAPSATWSRRRDEAAALLANNGIVPGSLIAPTVAAATDADGDGCPRRRRPPRPSPRWRPPRRRPPRSRPRPRQTVTPQTPTTTSAPAAGGVVAASGLAVGLVERRIGLLFAVFLGMLVLAGARAGWLGVVQAPTRSRAPRRPSRRPTSSSPPGAARSPTSTAPSWRSPSPRRRSPRRPYLIKDPAAAAAKLATVLRKPEEELLSKLARRDTGFVYVAHGVPTRRAQRARSSASRGSSSSPSTAASYPRDWMASQLLGNVGTDGHGLSGLEYEFDRQLRGRTASGGSSATRSATRSSCARTSARCRAQDVRLTLDANIQDHTEEVLAEVGEEWQPEGRDRARDGPARRRRSWRSPTGRASTPTGSTRRRTTR